MTTQQRLAGSETDVNWDKVQVGQVVKIRDDELFPADILCLYTSLPDKVRLCVKVHCSITGPMVIVPAVMISMWHAKHYSDQELKLCT